MGLAGDWAEDGKGSDEGGDLNGSWGLLATGIISGWAEAWARIWSVGGGERGNGHDGESRPGYRRSSSAAGSEWCQALCRAVGPVRWGSEGRQHSKVRIGWPHVLG